MSVNCNKAIDSNPFEAEATAEHVGPESTNPFDLEENPRGNGERCQNADSFDADSRKVNNKPCFTAESDYLLENIRSHDSPDENEEAALQDTINPFSEESGRLKISFDSVAKKLLDESFFLTALELHTELMESGRDLKRLRNFFTNPANFETGVFDRADVLKLPRTSSVQTFDSLDFTRYSDDNDREVGDRLAVSEFELRKAKETIRTLREQLTMASEKPTAGGPTPSQFSTDTLVSPSMEFSKENHQPVLSHESMAINFLVNEFLLQNDYRLTSVTFSEEVTDQDFEDWDEVGLNVPRPADILTLYRNYSHCNPVRRDTKDFSCSVNLDLELNPFVSEVQNSTDLLNKLNEENGELLTRNDELTNHIRLLTGEIDELKRRLKSAEPIVATTPTHPVSRRNLVVEQEKSLKSSDVSEGRTSNRSVPENFLKTLRSQISRAQASEDTRILEEIEAVQSTDGVELVDCLGRSMLNIIPNVLLNKRDELIPLIVRAAVMHEDISSRENLLSLLFNIIKKPEDDQRRLIVSGCVAFAKLAGPTRTEAELLPHCWEQIGHKLSERRLLVAETCGALVDHIPPGLISSLVLSMLQQMLKEDKSEQVREAVVKSLAVVCLYIEDKDKFGQVSDLVQRALTDTCETSAVAARTFLVPSFGFWADELRKLQLGVVSLFVRKIGQIVLTSGVNQSANEVLLLNYFSCLQTLTPLLFRAVLRDGPYVNSIEPSLSKDTVENIHGRLASRYPTGGGPLDNVLVLFHSEKELFLLTNAYDKHTAQEWFQSWNCLDYLLKDMLPQLLAILNSLEVTLSRAVPAAVRYMHNLSRTFGRGLWTAKIKPLFGPPLFIPRDKNDLSNFSISYATLPVFCAGVVSCFKTEEDWKELRYFLRSRLVEMAEKSVNRTAVTCTFVELCKVWENHDDLLSLIWECIPHKSGKVRCLCAAVLSSVVRFMELSLLRSRVLPALVTLAADNESKVRISTLPGFGAILEVASAENDIMDKTRLQLSSIFEDSDNFVTAQLVRTMALAAPNLESHFRDDFIVPQLAVLSMKSTCGGDPDSKKALTGALFEAYSAYSCCFLSMDALLEAFIPGLRSLIKDLDAEHAKIASSILKDAEAKLTAAHQSPNDIDRRASVGGEVTVEEVRATMLNKFRDFKDRMDHHRDNVPNLFKKK